MCHHLISNLYIQARAIGSSSSRRWWDNLFNPTSFTFVPIPHSCSCLSFVWLKLPLSLCICWPVNVVIHGRFTSHFYCWWQMYVSEKQFLPNINSLLSYELLWFTKFIALVTILMSGTGALMPPSTEQTNTLNAEFIMQPFLIWFQLYSSCH